MKTILLTFFIFLTTFSFGQVANVFSIDKDNYTITFSKNDNNYNFNLSNTGKDHTGNVTLPKLDINTSKNGINQKTAALVDTTPPKKTENGKSFEEMFNTFAAKIYSLIDSNNAPIAGTLKIAEHVYLYRKIKHRPASIINGIEFKIDKVQIVFQQGFIQDIIVDGKIIADSPKIKTKNFKLEDFTDAELRFTNYYGIGFSSKKNIKNLDEIYLYPNQNKSNEKSFMFSKKVINKEGKVQPTDIKLFVENEICIKLGQVIESYDFSNDLYKTDYSPANIKVTIMAGDKPKILYKDKTFKILEATTFSDFLGFNSNKPNGLIQIELEKKFNINTTRYKYGPSSLGAGWGTIEYIKLIGGITKIEETNRSLKPTIMQDENDTLNFKSYTTPIDVLNHQNSYIGANVNLFFFDFPSFKSQIHINGGFRFAQTNVQDSIKTINSDKSINSKPKEYNLTYWQFFPEVILHVIPETRYGFYFTWRPKYFHSTTDGIELFKGLVKPETKTGSKRDILNWTNEFELLGYLYPNEKDQDSKFFIRWRLNSEWGYAKNNFSQFQVGYSFYILSRKK